MSIVIYGPQGCGKTRNAEALLKHYGSVCDQVSDDGRFKYPRKQRDWERLKAGRVLYLTFEPPKGPWAHSLRFIPYAEAAKAAGVTG